MILLGNCCTDRIIGESFKNPQCQQKREMDILLNVNSVRCSKEVQQVHQIWKSHYGVRSVQVNKTDRSLAH